MIMEAITITNVTEQSFHISFPYDKYLVRRVKLLDGAKWNGTTWEVDRYAGWVLNSKGEKVRVDQLRKVKNGHMMPNVEHGVKVIE